MHGVRRNRPVVRRLWRQVSMRLRRRALQHLRTRCVAGLRVALRGLRGLLDGDIAHPAMPSLQWTLPHLPRVGLSRRGVLGPPLADRNVRLPDDARQPLPQLRAGGDGGGILLRCSCEELRFRVNSSEHEACVGPESHEFRARARLSSDLRNELKNPKLVETPYAKFVPGVILLGMGGGEAGRKKMEER